MKIKALIICTFITQLICAFVLAYAKSRFSHEAAQIKLYEASSKAVLSGSVLLSVKFLKPLFHVIIIAGLLERVSLHSQNNHLSRVVRKLVFCICENKDADQLRGYREADQRLCFRYLIVQPLYFIYTKFQASSHVLWLQYSLICVGPGRKPRRPVFSQ